MNEIPIAFWCIVLIFTGAVLFFFEYEKYRLRKKINKAFEERSELIKDYYRAVLANIYLEWRTLKGLSNTYTTDSYLGGITWDQLKEDWATKFGDKPFPKVDKMQIFNLLAE